MDAPVPIPVAMMAGFMILGAILSMGKCSFLIAGYNMMNRGQKKQYDEQALCRFMGKIMYCLAFAMLLWLCLLYTSLSPRDRSLSRMPSSA